MFGNISRGSSVYFLIRCVLVLWTPMSLCILGDMFLPFMYGLGWLMIYIPLILGLTMLWEAWWDWRELYDNTLDVSDESAALTPEGEKGFVTLLMPRAAPPRLLWAVI